MTTAAVRRRFPHLLAEVAAWPGVALGPHEFGAVEVRLDGRQLAHLHADGALDLPLARPLRDALVGAGGAAAHRWAPETGWAEYRLASDGDPHALRLLRLAVLYRTAASRTAASAALADAERAALVREADAMCLAPTVRAALDRVLGRPAPAAPRPAVGP